MPHAGLEALEALELPLVAVERLGRAAPPDERQDLALPRVFEPEGEAAVHRERGQPRATPPEMRSSPAGPRFRPARRQRACRPPERG